jgi:hypothetical protein
LTFTNHSKCKQNIKKHLKKFHKPRNKGKFPKTLREKNIISTRWALHLDVKKVGLLKVLISR